MRYMGGKFRQSKAIVEVLRPFFNENTVYVEPFCGGMWSATRVIKELRPKESILNDVNKPLMLLWDKCIKDGTDWLPVDQQIVEDEYQKYRKTQDDGDPLTAWYGIALSFGGKWFGGVARNSKDDHTYGYIPERKSMYKKVEVLQKSRVSLHTGGYFNLCIPDGAVVYCDPPYEGRTKAHHFGEFDYEAFWQWVRELSKRCVVFTSCFDCPSDFETVHSWGDTVVRHHASKGSDGTCEKLVVWEGASYAAKTKEDK